MIPLSKAITYLICVTKYALVSVKSINHGTVNEDAVGPVRRLLLSPREEIWVDWPRVDEEMWGGFCMF